MQELHLEHATTKFICTHPHTNEIFKIFLNLGPNVFWRF